MRVFDAQSAETGWHKDEIDKTVHVNAQEILDSVKLTHTCDIADLYVFNGSHAQFNLNIYYDVSNHSLIESIARITADSDGRRVFFAL